MKKKISQPTRIKGMVFVILSTTFFSSCCITGYCQMAANEEVRQEGKEIMENK
ncbi:hypothetical protein [Dysgonomonas sp. 511]|uniref:hypothetical protein n=1 Tax=Dysgonomonas sp. 511 TaxID=2302930 RepID=UPI0013CFC800|nr:hypothetical protein [Dysgonomonas sp. 511]